MRSDIPVLAAASTPGITGLLGGVSILGFDVSLPGRGKQWLGLQDGLNVLYGKNGSGKSSILEAFRNFSTPGAVRSGGPSVAMYLEVDVLAEAAAPMFGWVLAHSGLEESDVWPLRRRVSFEGPSFTNSPLPNEGSRTAWQEDASQFWKEFTGGSSLLDDASFVEKLRALDPPPVFRGIFEGIFRAAKLELPREADVAALIAGLLRIDVDREGCPLTERYHHGWPNWYLNYLSYSLSVALFAGIEPRRVLDRHHVDFDREWIPTNVSASDLMLDSDWPNDYVTFRELNGMSVRDLMEMMIRFRLASTRLPSDVPDEVGGISYSAVADSLLEIGSEGLFRVSKNAHGEWTLQPVCRRNNADSALRKFQQAEDTNPGIVKAMFSGMFTEESANGEFLSLSMRAFDIDWDPIVKHLPFVLLDICESSGIEESIRQFLPSLLGFQTRSRTLDEERHEIQSALDEMMSEVSSYFSTIDVGVLAVRAKLRAFASTLIEGTMIKVEYLDKNSRSWHSLVQASSAQQKWMDLAFNLYAAGGYRSPVLVIADEPDQGLHLSAGKSISQALRDTGRTCLIASHSPGVLRDPAVNLLHVSRGPTGETLVEPMTRSEDPMSSAIILGLDPVDLLPNIRVAVFVEGEHDLEVLRSFLVFHAEKTGRRRSVDLIKIFANRGIGQMVNAIDARVLLDYMDCDIVAVADRVRSDLFSPLVAELVERQRRGDGESKLEKRLQSWFWNLRERSQNGGQQRVSGEERAMQDLLSVAIRRRAAHRVHIQGIAARDITELLPSGAYNLKKSWDDLHSEHEQAREQARRQVRASNPPRDFKKWVGVTHHVDLSTRNVVATFRTAFESPEGPPGELVEIADLILGLAEKGRSTN